MKNEAFGSMVKGIGAGMILGVTAGIVGNRILQNNKKIRRSTNKAMRAVEDLWSDTQRLFR